MYKEMNKNKKNAPIQSKKQPGNTKKQYNPFYQQLSPEINGVFQGDPEKYLGQIASEDMPSVFSNVFHRDIRHVFLLKNKQVKNKKVRKNKKILTRKQRRDLNLLKLPINGWSYSELEQTRKMWLQYMRENMHVVAYVPKVSGADWTSFSVSLSKAEIIGAEIKVVRSKIPSVVGIAGTVVLETKNSLQVVTKEDKLKILLKEPSVFSFEVDNKRFTVFGKHLLTRPSERSVKKIKSYMHLDL